MFNEITFMFKDGTRLDVDINDAKKIFYCNFYDINLCKTFIHALNKHMDECYLDIPYKGWRDDVRRAFDMVIDGADKIATFYDFFNFINRLENAIKEWEDEGDIEHVVYEYTKWLYNFIIKFVFKIGIIKKFRGWIDDGEVYFVVPLETHGYTGFVFTKRVGLYNLGFIDDFKETMTYNQREKDIIVEVKDLGDNNYELINIEEV